MTNEERDTLNRRIAEKQVLAELALNQRIADALAAKYKAEGRLVERAYPTPMEFTTDPGAAHNAAAEILPCGYSLDYHKVEKYYDAECSPNRLDGGGTFEGDDDEPAPAICIMIEAFMDAQEKQQ